jgi:nucleoside 2-deoxyribosyltransferase
MIESGLFVGLRPKAMNTVLVPIMNCRLTPAGWKRYTELSKSVAVSRFGFVAMKYGDAQLDALVADHFAPEVRKTGFDLRRLDQSQPAGLIDDQLRVNIRRSRFLVCDLTHGNRGAYWESGFAEGLGKPVIYTCRKDVFEDRQHEHYPHFDTNHMVTVTVRATLPSEALLTD